MTTNLKFITIINYRTKLDLCYDENIILIDPSISIICKFTVIANASFAPRRLSSVVYMETDMRLPRNQARGHIAFANCKIKYPTASSL